MRYRKGPLTKTEMERRAARLRTARRAVKKYEDILEEIKVKKRKITGKLNEIEIQEIEGNINLSNAIQTVENLEKAFDSELEQGLWK